MTEDLSPTPEMLDATKAVRAVMAPVLAALGYPRPHTCETELAFMPWSPVGFRDADHTVFAYINTNDDGFNLSVTAADVPLARAQLLEMIRQRVEKAVTENRRRRDEYRADVELWRGAQRLLQTALQPPAPELSDESSLFQRLAARAAARSPRWIRLEWDEDGPEPQRVLYHLDRGEQPPTAQEIERRFKPSRYALVGFHNLPREERTRIVGAAQRQIAEASVTLALLGEVQPRFAVPQRVPELCDDCGCVLARSIGGLEEHEAGCAYFPL